MTTNAIKTEAEIRRNKFFFFPTLKAYGYHLVPTRPQPLADKENRLRSLRLHIEHSPWREKEREHVKEKKKNNRQLKKSMLFLHFKKTWGQSLSRRSVPQPTERSIGERQVEGWDIVDG